MVFFWVLQSILVALVCQVSFLERRMVLLKGELFARFVFSALVSVAVHMLVVFAKELAKSDEDRAPVQVCLIARLQSIAPRIP